MANHLKQTVTTLTTMWKITRMDGKVFCFTELDEDVTYAGDVYKSTGGFNKSAMKNSATFAVDNLEVNGFLSDDTIPDTELRNGAFDYAEVEIFMVNYRDLTMGTIKLRYGYFGEVRSAPSGAFLVELRGLVQLLGQKIGEVYTPECRADLGDKRCGFKLVANTHMTQKAYALGDRVIVPVIETTTMAPERVPIKDGGCNDPTSGIVFGNASIVTSSLFVQPYEGTGFARLRKVGSLYCSMRQAGTLVTGAVTPEKLATGKMKLAVSMQLVALEEGPVVGYDITYYSGVNGGGSIVGTVSRNLGNVRARNNWQLFTSEETIPATARYARITVYIISAPVNGIPDVGIDAVELLVKEPPQAVDYRIYGGVEFECTYAGTTGSVRPVFNPTIDAITPDGLVDWKCVTPRHVFLDQVAIDSTDSSTLTLTNVDKPDGWFNWGVVEILSGENAGFKVEASDWNNTTKKLQLAMPVPHQTLAGDYVKISTGCDKTRPVCRDKFNNLLNFRGEPDVPGINQYFKVAGMEK